MSRADVIGLVCGLVIGLGFGLWHVVDLQRRQKGLIGWQTVAVSALRLTLMMVALLAALTWTEANKYWLTGSLAVAYSVPLFWKLKRLTTRNK